LVEPPVGVVGALRVAIECPIIMSNDERDSPMSDQMAMGETAGLSVHVPPPI
jgi:hypothetical protein